MPNNQILTAYNDNVEAEDELDLGPKSIGSKRKRDNDEIEGRANSKSRDDEDAGKDEEGPGMAFDDFIKILSGTAAAANTAKASKKSELKNPFDIPDVDGNTPLHIACKSGFSQQAAQMIVLGANPMATNKDGDTAIHIAQKNGQYEVVEVIMQILLKISEPKKKSKEKDKPPAGLYL